MSVLYHEWRPEARQPPALRMIRMSNRASFLPPPPMGIYSATWVTRHQVATIWCWITVYCLKVDEWDVCTKTAIIQQRAIEMIFLSLSNTWSLSLCMHACNYTLNRCPVGLNFSVSLPLIFDVPCIALIMYLASVQMWQWWTPSSA